MNDKKFEWYYYDVHTVDGYDIVFTMHNKPFMSVFDIALFDLFIYEGNKVLYHHYFIVPRDKLSVSPGGAEIKADGGNSIRNDGRRITLKIHDDQIDLNLVFESKINNAEPLKVDFPVTEGKFFNWVIYAPVNQVSGELRWENRSMTVQGTGYHDSNYGNINCRNELKGWIWAKYFIDDTLYIYGEVNSRSCEPHYIFVKADEKGIRQDRNIRYIADNDRVIIENKINPFEFKKEREHLVDDIYFYISPSSDQNSKMAKLHEIMAHFSLKYRPLGVFKKLLNNCHYQRIRQTGTSAANQNMTSFREIMRFDEI